MTLNVEFKATISDDLDEDIDLNNDCKNSDLFIDNVSLMNDLSNINDNNECNQFISNILSIMDNNESTKVNKDTIYMDNKNNKYKVIDFINRGRYGAVHKVTKMNGDNDDRVYALKVQEYYKTDDNSDSRQKIVNNEINIFKKINNNCDNIIKFYDIFDDINGDNYEWESDDCRYNCILLPLYDCDFDSILKDAPLDINFIKYVSYSILNALQYMHENNIIYRDLKPNNILLNYKDKTIVLSDFSVARYVDINAMVCIYIIHPGT